MARQQQGQANQTFGSASGNAATYGGNASTINSQLTPFLEQRLNNPQGYSQGDIGAMLANAFNSSGGATSGITGQADLTAGRMRNNAGFSTALDSASRARTAADASTSEGIAADNANVKLSQQNDAAKMLQGLYGTNVGAADASLNTADNATRTGITAGQSGWLQQMSGLLSSIGSLGNLGNLRKH